MFGKSIEKERSGGGVCRNISNNTKEKTAIERHRERKTSVRPNSLDLLTLSTPWHSRLWMTALSFIYQGKTEAQG